MSNPNEITTIPITEDIRADISKVEDEVYKVSVMRENEPLLIAIFGYHENDVPRQAIAIAYRMLVHKRDMDETITVVRGGKLNEQEASELSRLDSLYTNASMENRHTPPKPTAKPDIKKAFIPTPAGTINVLERGEKDYPGVTIELVGNDGKSVSAAMMEYNPSLAAVELLAWTPEANQANDDPDVRRVMSAIRHTIWDDEVDLSNEAIEQARLDMEDGMTFSRDEIEHMLNEQSAQWYDDEVSNLSHGENTLFPAGKKLVVFAELGKWNGTAYAYSLRSESRLSAILTSISPMDHLVVYDDGRDVHAEASHHDGTNRYTFRLVDNDKTTKLKEKYHLSKLSAGPFKAGEAPAKAWEELIAMTESLSPMVSAVYGWNSIQ